MTSRRTIGGTLDRGAMDALYGRDRYRPLDRDAMRAAVIELAARGLTPHDISRALSLSVGAVLDLLSQRSQ